MTAADRLGLSIQHADGRVTRWGPDDPDPTDIPGDLSFSTAIPGGFRDMSCSLLRRIDIEYSDQALLDTVRVYAPGNRTVWEGRVRAFPRSHGGGFQVTPQADGWSAHLSSDDPSYREIIVDRAFGSWVEPPLTRKIAIAGATLPQGGVPTNIGDGIGWGPVSGQALAASDTNEVWYIAPAGLTLARLGYQGGSTGAFTNFEAPTLYTNTLRDGTGTFAGTALTYDNTVRSASPAAQPAFMLRAVTTGAVTPGSGWLRWVSKVAVYGNHGLTLRAITGEPDGVWASDVIRNAVTRAAPLLSTAGITDSDFAIPHITFPELVTAADVILEANKYHLWPWGVYDNREFFYRDWDDSEPWQARISTGASFQPAIGQLDFEGDTADSVYNGALVFYTDGNGNRKVVGPPAAYWYGGTALADDTSVFLVDTDPENPVNAHAIPRRWGKLEVSFPTTTVGAIQLGMVWLNERAQATRRGTLVLNGTVKHPTEGEVPVSRVRAGDFVEIVDGANSVPRKIISTSYTHGTRTVSCDLDNTPQRVEALIERGGVNLVGSQF